MSLNFVKMDSWSCSLQELLQDDKIKEQGSRMNGEESTPTQSENSLSLSMEHFSDKALAEGRVDVELVEAEYVGPNCVVFSYFKDSALSEVEKHFRRSLSRLCKNKAGEKESNNNEDGKLKIILYSLLIKV